uniref:Unkown protein n=1 Tax=Riptortus pedestris TaxID=329032 RepID=R4WRX5_RIPPE|nr:unkown protein [Riptortus pedestris]
MKKYKIGELVETERTTWAPPFTGQTEPTGNKGAYLCVSSALTLAILGIVAYRYFSRK